MIVLWVKPRGETGREKKENGWHSTCWEKNVASASIWRWKGGDKGCTPKLFFRIIYKFVVIYCPDTFAVFQEVSRKNPPSSERESGHQNDDDHAKENESDNARFPPSGGNKGDQVM